MAGHFNWPQWPDTDEEEHWTVLTKRKHKLEQSGAGQTTRHRWKLYKSHETKQKGDKSEKKESKNMKETETMKYKKVETT